MHRKKRKDNNKKEKAGEATVYYIPSNDFNHKCWRI